MRDFVPFLKKGGKIKTYVSLSRSGSCSWGAKSSQKSGPQFLIKVYLIIRMQEVLFRTEEPVAGGSPLIFWWKNRDNSKLSMSRTPTEKCHLLSRNSLGFSLIFFK